MKSLLTLILVAFSVFALSDDSSWSMAEGWDEGKPVIIRFRESVPSGVKKFDYPHLVVIRMEYEPFDSIGMPTPETYQTLVDVEEAFSLAIEENMNAYMMVSFLGNGVREWQVYTKDKAVLQATFNRALEDIESLPIGLFSELDPAWSAYYRFFQE